MLFLGFIGFADDYEKVPAKKKFGEGIRAWHKLAAQFLLALFVFLYLRYFENYPDEWSRVYIPFLKNTAAIDLGFSHLGVLRHGDHRHARTR